MKRQAPNYGRIDFSKSMISRPVSGYRGCDKNENLISLYVLWRKTKQTRFVKSFLGKHNEIKKKFGFKRYVFQEVLFRIQTGVAINKRIFRRREFLN